MTLLDDAMVKRTNRRNAGAMCLVVPQLVTDINARLLLALGGGANITQNTYVVGYWATTQEWYGVGIPVANRPTVIAQLQTLPGGEGATAGNIDWLGRPPLLHAEMTVVQHVINTHGVGKNHLQPLTICCSGKPCCADCCGWMTRYAIAHGYNCTDKGSSQGWTHPITGAGFRGEKLSDFTYSKGNRSASWLYPDG
ncbi:nucleic acid/nucleotide deaminase domain-containing protein [Xanthomonas campestris pv. trichodesmae]|uniref:hypothetical protein n=1 Tax=Xanthomonas TaxID=338 RepID=UPI001116F910|nr:MULTISPECIES: hypothetical protein [Xanthomonas]MBV6781637.1 nucleic acid/nucleotide deaminase domain-containing protein [Xanthomonas campestris pv. trichodesmae]